MSNLTLRKIKNTDFPSLYARFILGTTLTTDEYRKLLAIAVIFINSTDIHVQRLGYRIIVAYSNQTRDFSPLYEIATNQGLYPITQFIDSHHLKDNQRTFFTELNASYVEIYKTDKTGNVYCSEEQYLLNGFYLKEQERSIAIIAPTSYGKTDLIIKTIRDSRNKNICVITPTKALLAQTKRRIRLANIDWIEKIVIHPEMYRQDDSCCVAVLTQERLLRLLKDNIQLSFDYVIVDEAHGLLGCNQRDEILASVIVVLNKRNPCTAFKFLTPFLKNEANLKVRYSSYDLSAFMVKEYIKTENIYLYDTITKSGLSLYDQFLDEWYDVLREPKDQTSIEFIIGHSAEKNIIYFNKPIDIEHFASNILNSLPDIPLSPELDSAITHIAKYINPEYTLVKCLKKGIIYHHGSIADSIRAYIEYLYLTIPEIRYVITSSTLLEGVNLPATKMFLMDNRKGQGNLSVASFKNLIGRICRFHELFDRKTGSLDNLQPEIFLVVDKYYARNANCRNFISTVLKVDRTISDDVNNILLESTPITERNTDKLIHAQEYLENYENGILRDYTRRYAQTEIGKACILNNVTEIDVFEDETSLQNSIREHIATYGIIADSNTLVDIVKTIFLPYIKRDANDNILRFNNESARNYYKMFLKWKLDSLPYSQMISYIVKYWQNLIRNGRDTIVYVGKWGNVTRDNGFRKLWMDLRTKSEAELINVAIVRIKEEQDFIDNTIMKFIEVLNDIHAIEDDLYKKLKYGTVEPNEIVLVRNGVSLSLAKLLLDKYRNAIRINTISNTINLSKELISQMKDNGENQILIFEAESNIF